MGAIKNLLDSLNDNIKENPKVFALYATLRLLVVVALVRSILIGNYENVVVCVITLLLLLVPSLLENALRVEIAPLFEVILYLFIFAAEVLGELNNFYTTFPFWDTALHTLNGFMFAAVGFATVDLLNRSSKFINLSPLYLTLVAFCFSMTIGVLWEFIECGGDLFLGQDMQKDFIVQSFQSTKLDETNSQIAVPVTDVTRTEIYTASGETYTVEGGFLDIGIRDTMKDLGVNLIGAVVFCAFGFGYLKSGGTDKKAARVVEGLRVSSVPAVEAEDGSEAEEGPVLEG